jgi:uncharacterized delta-60 repeat protein
MTYLLKISKILLLAISFIIANNLSLIAQNVDPNFKPVIKGNPNITAISVLPDGKVIIAGNISSIGKTPTTAVVKLHPDGTLDKTFKTSIYLNESARITALFVDNSGKVLVGSNNYTLNGRNCLIRLNPDGKFDETFSVGNDLQFINKIQQQPDGKYIVSSWTGNGLTRLNSDGSIDATFDPYQEEFGHYTGALQLLSDGQLICAIHFTSVSSGLAVGKLVKLNADGSLDETFETGTCDESISDETFINDIKIQPDGKILIAGQFDGFKEQEADGIFRLNEDGTIDETFTTSGVINSILDRYQNNEIEISEDGKILVAGSPLGAPLSYKVLRLNADGSMDATFSIASFELPDNTPFQPLIELDDERIYVAGDHLSCNNVKGFGITAINTSGLIIEDFSPKAGGNPVVNTAYKQKDGKIIIGGEFSQVDGFYINNIIRFNADGSVDTTFLENIGTGTNAAVRAINAQSDSSLIIGGDFNSVNGFETGLLARIKPNGLVDTEFIAHVQKDFVGEGVNKILVDSKDQIIIGGAFIYANNEPRTGFAVFNPDGTLNPSIGATPIISNSEFRVADMVYQSNKKLLVGGTIHNEADNYGFLVRLNTDGTVDPGFLNSVSDIYVSNLAVIDSNKIIVGNHTYSSDDKNYLTQLGADGEIIDDTVISFNQNEGGFPQINSIQHPGDDQLIIGGRFTSVNDVEKPALIKVSLNGDVDEFFKYDVEGKVTQFLRADSTHLFVVGSFNRIGNDSSLFCIAKINIDFPKAPTNLDGESSNLKSPDPKIELNWKNHATNETGFSVERSTDNKLFESIATIGSNSSSFMDQDVEADKTYFYRVKAYNTNGGSSYSNVVEIMNSASALNTIENSNKVLISPNPGNGDIKVTLQDFEDLECDIEIYSVSGNRIFYRNYKVLTLNNSISLDIVKEPAGLYFIKITSKKYSKSIKYIKY